MKKTLLAAAMTAAMIPAAHAQSATAANDGDQDAKTLDAVSVVGKGQTRSVQRIRPQDTLTLPTGTSLQKTLNTLPGVNAQAVDAMGVNEQSLSISVRGFNTTHLGYTLDGVPLGDGAFNNYNGLSISRALIAENLGYADLAMGIGNLGIASTSNLGGAITYVSSAPAKEFGARVSETLGSDNTSRTFLRVDTGEYNGFSAYLSGMTTKQDLYVDQGAYNWSKEKQFNGKLQYHWDRGTITAFADVSRTNQADNFYMSKDAVSRVGWDWGGYAPDWDTAVARAYCQVSPQTAASTAGCVPTGAAGDKASDAFGFTGGQILRNDDLYYLSGDFDLTSSLSLHAQVYHHKDKGAGNNWNPGWSSDNTVPWLIRDTLYAIDRTGEIASLKWSVGANELQAGFWYEENTSSAERYQFTDVTGPKDLSHYLGGTPQSGTFAQKTDWNTRQYFIQDTVHLLDDRLTLDFGFKGTDAVEDATPEAGIAATPIPPTSSGQFAKGSLKAKDSFLPQAGVQYQIADEHEVYASYAENIAMFQGGFKLGPLAVSQAVWDSQGQPLKPERSKSLEGGYRFLGEQVQATVAVYHVNFDDRLLQYNPCNSREPNGPDCGNRFYNVGGVTSNGVELGVNWAPSTYFNWYNSASFNKSTYNDDYTQGGTVYATGGKQQVDTPKRMFSSVLSFRYAGWYASLQGKFTGERFYTYTNDQGFGGFTTFDFGTGYDFGKLGFVSDAKLSLNLTNLTDKRTASNFDNSVFAPVDPNGTIVVAHAMAPRQAFATLDLRF